MFNSLSQYYKHTIYNRSIILKYDKIIRELAFNINSYRISKHSSNSILDLEKSIGLFQSKWFILPNDKYIMKLYQNQPNLKLIGYSKLRYNWIEKKIDDYCIYIFVI